MAPLCSKKRRFPENLSPQTFKSNLNIITKHLPLIFLWAFVAGFPYFLFIFKILLALLGAQAPVLDSPFLG